MLAFIICNHVVHLHIAASALLPFKIHQRRKEIKAVEGEWEGRGADVQKLGRAHAIKSFGYTGSVSDKRK